MKIIEVCKKMFSVLLILGAMLFGWYIVVQHPGDFSQDSYSYYDISKTFGSEFGRVGTIRQYIIKSDYNCSFPYVYPLLIFLIDQITGFGMESGVLLNCFLMPLTAFVFCRISRQFCNSPFCGAVIASFLFVNKEYLEEVYAGRAIPLAIFLTAVFFWLYGLFFSEKRKPEFAILIGFFAGLSAMTRFDEISLVAYFGLVLVILCFRNWRGILSYILGVGFAFLPWCIYCLKHFGTPYFSDNNGTALYIKPEVPSFVRLPWVQADTVRTAPAEWFSALLDKIKNTFLETFCAGNAVLCVCLVLILACAFRYLHQKPETLPNRRVWYLAGTVLLYVFAKLMMYALVGYICRRYYLESIIMLAFTALIIIYRYFLHEPAGVIKTILTVLLLVNAVQIKSADSLLCIANYRLIEQLDTALDISANSKDSVFLIVNDLDAFAFGGLTSWKTYVTPVNVSPETVSYVLSEYASPEWIAVDYQRFPEICQMLSERFPQMEYNTFYLYHMKGSES